jgi:transposase
MLQASATVKEAAASIGCSEHAVRNLRTKYRQTGSVTDKPCSSHPSVLLKQQKKIIYRKARATPKIEYDEYEYDFTCSSES